MLTRRVFIYVVATAVFVMGGAMPAKAQLTTPQLQAIKAVIDSDPALSSQAMNSDGHFAIAAALNMIATPDFWVWKSSVSKSDLVNSTGPDGTTFNWTGNGFITRSAGEQAAWREIFNGTDSVDPSKANVRQAFADIFSGSGNAAANRTHLLAVSRRLATRAEKALAAGTGSTATPAVMGYEGAISYQQVEAARQLP